jgi:hypothetical protein
MASAFAMPEALYTVSQIFQDFAQRYHLTLCVEGVDKHGSWEWSVCQREPITRFVTLDLTEEIASVGAGRCYQVEVWAEADHGQRFVRRLTAVFQVTDAELAHNVFRERLLASLSTTLDQVKTFQEHALTESYLFARPRA